MYRLVCHLLERAAWPACQQEAQQQETWQVAQPWYQEALPTLAMAAVLQCLAEAQGRVQEDLRVLELGHLMSRREARWT